MGPLGTLLASDHRQTLEFFFIGLKDVAGDAVDRRELLYNASVLAHYAQVSTATTIDFPTPSSLEAVFDTFVVEPGQAFDSGMLETAGTNCLMMAGFFEDQSRTRHNVRWYADLGAGFFFRAAQREAKSEKALLMDTMGRHFEAWRQRYALLSRELRDTPFLLNLPTPPRTM